jgi:hypothetical protein
MSELPDSLARFDRLLERAIERDKRHRRRRDRRRLLLRVSAATVIAGAIALGAASLVADDGPVVGTSIVGLASAHERAAAVLTPARGSIVHEVASHRHEDPDGSVSRWRDETWRQTSPPYARRQVTTRDGGIRVETATVGRQATQLYDAATGTIYTNPPTSGPALGTPMPATEGDPLRTQLLELLRSDDARDAKETTRGRRRVIRFSLDNMWPDGSVTKWSYVVDAGTYRPILLTTSTADGARTTTRFERYATLAPTEQSTALLSLRAQHPIATLDATEAGYQEAQARVYAQPARAGG